MNFRVLLADADGTLFGELSRENVASYNMDLVSSGVLEDVPLFNVLSVLEGEILNDAGEFTDTVSGEVTIALPQSRENLLFSHQNSIVLCGNAAYNICDHNNCLVSKKMSVCIINLFKMINIQKCCYSSSICSTFYKMLIIVQI